MNITHELRSWNDVQLSAMPCSHDMLEEIADRIDEAVDGMVKLPKGTDGEFWRYGDKLEIGNGLTVDIIGVSGDWLFYATENGFIYRTRAHDKRHYHAPTVDDVLRELVGKAQTLSCIDDEDKLVTEYAKRLTLAGDAE